MAAARLEVVEETELKVSRRELALSLDALAPGAEDPAVEWVKLGDAGWA